MRSDTPALRPDGAGLTLEPLERVSELEALCGEWRALWRRCPPATPFQSPDWLIPWWRCYGEGRLLSWAMRRSGQLVGLAPLYVYPDRPSRRVFLIGTGNTDYLDILCEAEHAVPMARLLFQALAQRRALWDVCDFQQLAPGAALLGAGLPAGWRDEVAPQDACPVLALAASRNGDEGQIWRKTQYYRRRSATLGDVALERAGGDRFDEIFSALVQLHHRRWQERDLPGVLATPRDREFHRAAARALLREGALRLYALRLGGRIIAALYGCHAHHRTYFYLSGFDPEFAALSPGTQIVAHAIEQAVQEGAMAFDFMGGREPYKYRWGAVDRTNMRRQMWLATRNGETDGAWQIPGRA